MLRATLPVVAALALAPAVADARTISSKKIQTPNKGLHCHALKVDGPGVECGGSWLPNFQKGLDLDPYVQLKPHGKVNWGERGDYTGYSGKTATLHYGDTWKRGGVTCKLSRSALTCRNLDKHGFTLKKNKFTRF